MCSVLNIYLFEEKPEFSLNGQEQKLFCRFCEWNETCSAHSRVPRVDYLVSWPNGNSFSDWNVVGFVVWIYRESANKSNSRLTLTFRGRQREIAPDSRSCMHISLLQKSALLFLRTPFHPVLVLRVSSLWGLSKLFARSIKREDVVLLTKEIDVNLARSRAPKLSSNLR